LPATRTAFSTMAARQRRRFYAPLEHSSPPPTHNHPFNPLLLMLSRSIF